MDIGVISDTHNFFDPKIPKLFSGVEHICTPATSGCRGSSWN